MQGLLKSFRAYGTAISLIPKLGLWKYFLIPGLLSIVFAVLIGLIAWAFSDDLGAWMNGWLSFSEGDGWWASIVNALVGAYQSITGFVGGVMIALLGFIIYKNIIIALLGPFMSPLSEKVEAYMIGNQPMPQPFWSTLVRGLRIGIRNVFREMLFMLPLLLLGLFPLFSIFCTGAIFLIQAYYAGFGNFDFVMERHLSRRDSIRFVRNNRGLAVGNGIPFILMLGVVVGIFFAPALSTIAATVAFHEKQY